MIALPEASDDPGQPGTRAWLVKDGRQGALWLRKSDGLPVSLAAFPNGDLLLLELVGTAGGMGTRVSLIDAADVQFGAMMKAEELALVAPPAIGARMEGASVRTGNKGEIFIYLIASDDRSPLYMFELDK